MKLGGFYLENIVTSKTTHLISAEPLRTVNLLRGIIRGIWILNYEWIVESVNSDKWLYEEAFEVTNFTRAISVHIIIYFFFNTANHKCNFFNFCVADGS